MIRLCVGGAPLSWRDAADGLASDPGCRSALTDALRSSPHPAFFFETCPVSWDTASRLFGFVLSDSPTLAAITPDARPFQGCFSAGAQVATFANRGRDATLVSPSPAHTPAHAGRHLAAFVRHAPPALVDAFWQATGRAIQSWWQARADPVWVSTSGLGVSWLHLRLDERPKYYVHRPFRAWPA